LPEVINEDVTLYCEVDGEGEPVTVVAHGLTNNCRELAALTPIVPGTKVRFDFRGRYAVARLFVVRRDDARSADSLVRAFRPPAGDSRTRLSGLLWLRLCRAAPYRGFVIRRLRQAPARPVSPTVC